VILVTSQALPCAEGYYSAGDCDHLAPSVPQGTPLLTSESTSASDCDGEYAHVTVSWAAVMPESLRPIEPRCCMCFMAALHFKPLIALHDGHIR